MDEIIEVILVVLYFLLTALGVVFALAAGSFLGAVTGFGVAVYNLAKAYAEETHIIRPPWKYDDEPARRLYLFGPGYVQIINTVASTFRNTAASDKRLYDSVDDMKDTAGALGVVMKTGALTFQLTVYAVSAVTEFVLCLIFGLLHAVVITVSAAVVSAVLGVVWLIDRMFLWIHRIFADCAVCHHRSVIPYYRCSSCGRIHKKLSPGAYGVFFHRCACSKRIPATFFLGRSSLSSVCPMCGSTLIASHVRPISLQLVGAPYAGKTVYMAAFFHQYLTKLRSVGAVMKTPSSYLPLFDRLETYYNGTPCPATSEHNARIYPLLVNKDFRVRRQFSVYDIAGEMFDGVSAEHEIQQEQFNYCDGILYVLDPFQGSSLKLPGRQEASFNGISSYSAVVSFINYMMKLSGKPAGHRFQTPLAVIISKADLSPVGESIGEERVKEEFDRQPQKYKDLYEARDALCKEFLYRIGLQPVVNMLEAHFSTIHFFPVSAMGHNKENTAYQPWGVLAPAEWLISLADEEYSRATNANQGGSNGTG